MCCVVVSKHFDVGSHANVLTVLECVKEVALSKLLGINKKHE